MSDEALAACIENELVEYERRMQKQAYDDAQCFEEDKKQAYDDAQCFEEDKKQHAQSSGGCCLLHQHDCHLLSVLYSPHTPLTP